MKDTRLPQNGKEGLLYGSIICLITVIVMLMLNIGTAFGGLTKDAFLVIVKMLPVIWIVAMLVESLIVGRIAEKLVNKFTMPSDGFNTHILFNILFCVTGMSAIMTILGSLIGNGISFEPFLTFFSHWPRNFCVAFWCEILLAQPTARFAMKLLHQYKERNLPLVESINEPDSISEDLSE